MFDSIVATMIRDKMSEMLYGVKFLHFIWSKKLTF